MKKDGQYWIKALLGIPVGAFFLPFAFGAESPWTALVILLGGFMSQDSPSVFELALRMLIPLIAFYLYSGVIAEDMRQFAVYILPREGNRTRWFFGRTAVAFFGTLAFFTVCALSAAIGIALISEGEALPGNVGKVVLALILTSGFNVASFSLLLNLISLKWDKRFALLIVLLLYMPGQFFSNLLRPYFGGWLVMLYPSAQAILAIHDVPWLARVAPDAFAYAIPGFTVAFSIVYCILFCAAQCTWGVRVMRRREFALF